MKVEHMGHVYRLWIMESLNMFRKHHQNRWKIVDLHVMGQIFTLTNNQILYMYNLVGPYIQVVLIYIV